MKKLLLKKIKFWKVKKILKFLEEPNVKEILDHFPDSKIEKD